MPKTLQETIAEAVGAASGGAAVEHEDDPLVTGEGDGDGTVDENDEGDAGGGDGDEGNGKGVGEGEGESAEGDGDKGAAGATDADADGAGDGKPAKTLTADEQKAADAAKAEAAALAVAEKAAERARLQAADPVNAPIPKDLKTETKTRIKKLVDMNKESTARVTAAEKDRNELIEMMQGTGAPPDELGNTLHFLRLSHSADAAQQAQALEYAQGLVLNLARRLGKAVPGVDMLAGHDDLKASVNSGAITRKLAEEMAAQREALKVRDTDNTKASEAQAFANARTQARADLNSLEAELKAVDPVGYAAKRAQLTAALTPVFKTMHPSKWAATFREAYKNLPAVAAPRPRVVPSGGGNQPLRARQPAGGSGGQVAEPKNFAEAVAAGIAKGVK